MPATLSTYALTHIRLLPHISQQAGQPTQTIVPVPRGVAPPPLSVKAMIPVSPQCSLPHLPIYLPPAAFLYRYFPHRLTLIVSDALLLLIALWPLLDRFS